MPLNTTVSHISPLVSYIPRSAWYEGDLSDPDLDKYSNKSYHYSNSTASVTFSWWGTGIWVFGGRRNWSGEYRVVLDNQEPQTFPGYAGGADEFQQVLFGSSNLPYAPHQIRITNTGASPATQSTLDIDYLVYETILADNGRIYHNDPGCTWQPANQNVWQVDETSHTTYDDLGAMELNFTVCSGITVYGYLGKIDAPLSVSVDGWAFTPLTPNTDITPLVPNVTHILYTNSNLQEGPHTLRVENNPLPMNGSGSRMSIAYSQILSLSDGTSSVGCVLRLAHLVYWGND
ncbi:hypothetical protein LXA43DRAFT_892035 [Ganoderma leucocontextum]|nr:hypothetical protein LXA43DRAFT_892035 [Ganoderma leucocontextum]